MASLRREVEEAQDVALRLVVLTVLRGKLGRCWCVDERACREGGLEEAGQPAEWREGRLVIRAMGKSLGYKSV